jgi:hypothetical protein
MSEDEINEINEKIKCDKTVIFEKIPFKDYINTMIDSNNVIELQISQIADKYYVANQNTWHEKIKNYKKLNSLCTISSKRTED